MHMKPCVSNFNLLPWVFNMENLVISIHIHQFTACMLIATMYYTCYRIVPIASS